MPATGVHRPPLPPRPALLISLWMGEGTGGLPRPLAASWTGVTCEPHAACSWTTRDAAGRGGGATPAMPVPVGAPGATQLRAQAARAQGGQQGRCRVGALPSGSPGDQAPGTQSRKHVSAGVHLFLPRVFIKFQVEAKGVSRTWEAGSGRAECGRGCIRTQPRPAPSPRRSTSGTCAGSLASRLLRSGPHMAYKRASCMVLPAAFSRACWLGRGGSCVFSTVCPCVGECPLF